MNDNPHLSPEPWAAPGDPLGVRLSASAALATIVSGDIPGACEELRSQGWKYAEPIVAEDGLVCSDGQGIHVVLQGTDSAADVALDFMFWRRLPWWYAPGMGWFAVGARRFADRVVPEILAQLRAVRQELGAQEVYLHCHSLAAGAAALIVIPVVTAGNSVRDVYPFEPPRPLGRGTWKARGSKKQHDDFCRRHRVRFWRILSLRNGVHDWVPLLPPMITGARHAGESWGTEQERPQGGTVVIAVDGSSPADVASGPKAKELWRGIKKSPEGPARWQILTRFVQMPRSHNMPAIAEALARRDLA